MEIGIHQPLRLEDATLYDDLGVTWTKFSADLGPEVLPDLDRHFDLAAQLGLRCVVDIRSGVDYLLNKAVAVQVKLAAEGLLEGLTGGANDVEQRATIVRNNIKIHALAYARMYELAGETVDAYKDRCQDWEFWGEAACPWVAGQVFGDRSATYAAMLEGVYASIKQADPTCRVWTSGNGMDGQLEFQHALLDMGGGTAFDVCNIHPYFMKMRDRVKADAILHDEYPRLREALQTQGRNQPFAATEWGYPTHNVDSVPAEVYLRSNVVQEGVRQLYWSEAPEWYERDLQIMSDYGFAVVIVHQMRDRQTPGAFWGDRCGLLDAEGRKKNTWDVVQRWAWAGREGKKAFAEEEN
jgi:hypothetical protein